MKSITLYGLCILAVFSTFAQAELNCPEMPKGITDVSHDVKSDISASVGRLAGIKVGEASIKTEIEAKAIYEKFPDVDKIFILQMLSATYCSALNSPSFTSQEREAKWGLFMNRVLFPELEKLEGPDKAIKLGSSKKTDQKKIENNSPVRHKTPESNNAQFNENQQSAKRTLVYVSALQQRNKGDYASAIKEFSILANNGDPRAQYQLGNLYYHGLGININYPEAFHWFQLAAIQGVKQAQHNLAVMYQKGLGTKLDLNKAWEWYSVAARNGYAPSQQVLSANKRSW